jgi:AraC-like DNA-binding protein
MMGTAQQRIILALLCAGFGTGVGAAPQQGAAVMGVSWWGMLCLIALTGAGGGLVLFAQRSKARAPARSQKRATKTTRLYHSRDFDGDARPLLFRRAQVMVDEHFADQEMTTSLVARKLRVSKEYLTAIFFEMNGTSFMDYVAEVRLRQATRLLQFSNLSVGEIAHAIGYCSSRDFADAFSKANGLSPKQFRSARLLA